jgi:multicomponent Na+:H+ antiporter subunit D
MAGSHLVPGPLLVALATAVLSLFVRSRPRARTALSLVGGLAYAGVVAALTWQVLRAGPLTYQVGDWGAPFGITLVADALAAFMLALTALVGVASLVASARAVGDYAQRVSYHPLFHFLLVGVSGAFLTGDLFNLFVWFEVMLMSSYVLAALYGTPEATGATLRYVVLNLVGSALMLVAIGGLYATLGTLNMADMSRRLADPAAYGVDPAPALGLSALLFAVFALKAGVVPFHFWVPEIYEAAPAPVTAMLAGVVKKVGVYATIRLAFTVLGGATLAGDAGGPLAGFYGPVLLAMAVASVIVGGVGAVGRDTLDAVLAFSSISQVGFILLPVAVAAGVGEGPVGRTAAGVALTAALVYTLNHAVAKSLLFLVAGTVEEAVGTTRLGTLGGLAGRSPWLGAAFLVGALALVGIPPLIGFFAKFLVFEATVRGGATLALAASLGGALFTIAYVTRVWNRAFWGERSPAVERADLDGVLLAVVAGLAAVVILLGVGFDPVYRFADAGADAALARQRYVDAVRFAAETAGESGNGGGHA